MIISEKKPSSEILAQLKGKDKILILGCSECSAACEVGGVPEVQEMKEFLEENGKEVVGEAVLTTACSVLLDKKELKPFKDVAYDAILSLACGDGVQTIADLDSAPVYPGANTLYIGKRVKSGVFEEMCHSCGACVLGRTAGVCPVTRCGKGLLNGPCGGQKDGMCEVRPENKCAWIEIYERLKDRGELEKMARPHGIRGSLKVAHPRTLDLREEQKAKRKKKKEARK